MIDYEELSEELINNYVVKFEDIPVEKMERRNKKSTVLKIIYGENKKTVAVHFDKSTKNGITVRFNNKFLSDDLIKKTKKENYDKTFNLKFVIKSKMDIEDLNKLIVNSIENAIFIKTGMHIEIKEHNDFKIFSPNEKAKIYNEVEKISVSETEKYVLSKYRVGQSKLRNKILEKKFECDICGIKTQDFLIVSHIIPWCNSNDEEKLELNNVLLLCPNHDSLFDKGYITFDDNGKVIISDKLNEMEQALLAIHDESNVDILSEEQRKFIKWHRENKFIGE